VNQGVARLLGSHQGLLLSVLPQFAQVGLNDALRLILVLFALFVACDLFVLVDGLGEEAVLFIHCLYHLLGLQNGHKRLIVHPVGSLKSLLHLLVDFVVVSKELLGEGFLLWRGHLRRRFVHVLHALVHRQVKVVKVGGRVFLSRRRY